MPHVVVVGAGFAGLSATAELAKEGFRVTLIDRHPYNTFQPLLYQVATGGLNAGDVTYSLRYFAARHAGVRFRRAGVTGIDHDAHEVLCDDGVRVDFDYLCVATGITTNHFGIPGAAEYTMSMYTRGDALRVRDTIFGSMEIIAGMSHPNTGAFTIVVVGGGATGVEMAGQLAELKTEALPVTYPELNPALLPAGRSRHLGRRGVGQPDPARVGPADRPGRSDRGQRGPAGHRSREHLLDR